jgi:type II secretion system protein G
MKNQKQKGFTLIELLVVIAIIGLLASVVLVSLGTARVKARDTKRKADFSQLTKALALYYDKNGIMPANVLGAEIYDDHAQFLQVLITDGVLTRLPKDPSSPTIRYAYYNYGAGSAAGAFWLLT